MKRRIIVNIILSFILFPILFSIKDYYLIEILHDQTYFYGTFWEYVGATLLSRFIAGPIIWLLFVMLPYNLIITKKAKKSSLKFYQKVLFFELILTLLWCLIGTFINLWANPYWKNLEMLLYFFPLSILFAGLVHLFVDRKEARHPSE
ncbi:hypothetical protein [Pedobacter duraquae]|uniref:Uncharacterized protein n=1 Tax=Pedobacter duraquae TaxID=425511 RepID=A0A4R6IHC8_9SPHI|nr:hypothetical protein [Pedobacter duraquae]TDO21298.1 hypothetical protein CLV32_2402 [Pedobacter duraquae]